MISLRFGVITRVASATLLLFSATRAVPQTPATVASVPAPIMADTHFLVRPYVQLGDNARPGKTESLTLVWHTPDTDSDWSVEVRNGENSPWKRTKNAPTAQRIALVGVDAHRVWTASVTGLLAGHPTAYRVLRDGVSVFESIFLPRKSNTQNSRFIVFGDCGADTASQRKIAYQTYLAKPDFVFITGDIVYNRGRISEYRQKYFPVYNADTASPETGAPLLRSTLFLASPGNHDILHRELDTTPDTLAYFLYWKQPMNGPLQKVGQPSTPTLSGPEENQKAYLTAAGAAYPRMANFSYDYGNAHWTVLDANPYVDWNDPALREWVRKDLAKAKNATWRFIGFHQPGFNSSKNHFSEQQMRVLAPVFETGNVDLVFSGHVHNYQRTYPMRFAPTEPKSAKGEISGTWQLDKVFDGNTQTKPQGVLYLVTGAGGAGLYNPEQQDKPETWQAFTHRFIADTHSLTMVDIRGNTLSVQQVSEDGTVLDTFSVTK